MTIPTLADAPRKIIYEGSGSMGPFTGDFRVFDKSDILVTHINTDGDETIYTLGTHYNVSLLGLGIQGFSVTLTAALNDGERLVLSGNAPISQPVRYANQGSFYAETHEESFDRLTIYSQEQKESLGRCLKINNADDASTTTVLPVSSVRANKALVFDADGNVSVSGVDYDESSLGAADAALGYRNEAQGFRNEAQTFKNDAQTASASAASSALTAATYGQYGSIYLSNNFV